MLILNMDVSIVVVVTASLTYLQKIIMRNITAIKNMSLIWL